MTPNRVLFTNFTEDFNIEDYRAEYEIDIIDLLSESYVTLENYAQDAWNTSKQLEWDDLLLELENETGDFIIIGRLDLWGGKVDVRSKVIYSNLREAITRCISKDTESIRIKHMGGNIPDDKSKFISIDIKHHDGTNIFQIRALKPTYKDSKASNKNTIHSKYWKPIELSF